MYLVYYIAGEFTHIVEVVGNPKLADEVIDKYRKEGIEAKYHKIDYIYKL